RRSAGVVSDTRAAARGIIVATALRARLGSVDAVAGNVRRGRAAGPRCGRLASLLATANQSCALDPWFGSAPAGLLRVPGVGRPGRGVGARRDGVGSRCPRRRAGSQTLA